MYIDQELGPSTSCKSHILSHSLSMIRQGNSVPRESFQLDTALYKLASSESFLKHPSHNWKSASIRTKNLQLSMRLK